MTPFCSIAIGLDGTYYIVFTNGEIAPKVPVDHMRHALIPILTMT